MSLHELGIVRNHQYGRTFPNDKTAQLDHLIDGGIVHPRRRFVQDVQRSLHQLADDAQKALLP